MRIGTAGADGRIEVELRGHSVGSLASEIAGFGARLEIVEPAELRQRLAAIGDELLDVYGAEQP